MSEPNKFIYIAGPMRGIPHFNFPRFNAVAYMIGLSKDVAEVFNPAARDNDRHGKDISAANPTGDVKMAEAAHGFDLRVALGEDLAFITGKCTNLLLLPGWENSSGAKAEWSTALALAPRIEITYLTEEFCKDLERVFEASTENASAA